MNAQNDKKKTVRRAAIVVLTALALYGVWLYPLRSRLVAEGHAAAHAAEWVATAAKGAAPVPASPAARPKAALPKPPPAEVVITSGHLIGHVALEKTSACRGEDVKVTITPAAGEENAKFDIEGVSGTDQILTITTPETEQHQWITAASGDKRDFEEIVVSVLSDDDPSCAGKPSARIVARPFTQIDSEYDFAVEPLHGLGPIAKVEWAFGDGSTRSGDAHATHGYRDRPQTSSASSFIVTADVVDDQGVQIRARTSISLPNPHYMIRSMTGQRPLPTAEQRMIADNGKLRYVASFTNLEDKTVRFDTAHVRLRSCTKSEPRELDVPASEILATTEIGPALVSDVRVNLPPAWSTSDICSVELSLSGDTEPPSLGEPTGERGLPAREVTADLAFATGMPKSVEHGGDPELASQVVSDPKLKARLLELMARKGTNMITEEDLRAD